MAKHHPDEMWGCDQILRIAVGVALGIVLAVVILFILYGILSTNLHP